jgi:cation transport ATPase
MKTAAHVHSAALGIRREQLSHFTRWVGVANLVISAITVIPMTVHLFIDKGGLFHFGWLMVPLVVPLCAGSGYAALAVWNERWTPVQLTQRLVAVHLVVALAIILSYAFISWTPFLLFSLPLFTWAFYRYRKNALIILLLVNLLTLAVGFYFLALDWDNGHQVALIELFRQHPLYGNER